MINTDLGNRSHSSGSQNGHSVLPRGSGRTFSPWGPRHCLSAVLIYVIGFMRSSTWREIKLPAHKLPRENILVKTAVLFFQCYNSSTSWGLFILFFKYFIYILLPFSFLQCPICKLMTSLSLLVIVTYTYINEYIFKCNILCLFSDACIYTISGLIIWY